MIYILKKVCVNLNLSKHKNILFLIPYGKFYKKNEKHDFCQLAQK